MSDSSIVSCLRKAIAERAASLRSFMQILKQVLSLCHSVVCSMGDSSVAGFLRKAFAERSAKLLTGSLKAPDGAALAAVTSKLNEEEKTCESGLICCGFFGV